jgi:hypothetical protein
MHRVDPDPVLGQLVGKRLGQAGPHHVLVQLSLDSEPEEVAAVVSAALSGYGEYVRQVARWTTAQASDA